MGEEMKHILLGMTFFLAGLAFSDSDALYKQGVAVYNTDPSAACALFVRAADAGNVSAMAGAGHCYETGTGTEVDYAKAIAWYEKAVAQNSLKACEGLARIYATCEDPEFHDGERAVKYAAAVAKKKPREADVIRLLAAAYARNLEFEKAQQAQRTAIRYSSADKLQAMKEQVGRYEKGEPYPAVASTEWLRNASNQGSIWAMFQMSEMKCNDGNFEEAFAFCHGAMLKGSGKAAVLVGDFYWTGKGTQRDNLLAVQSYEAAQKHGVELDAVQAERLKDYTEICEKLRNSNAAHCISVGELVEKLAESAGKNAKKPWTEEERRNFNEKFLSQALYMYSIAEKKGASAAKGNVKRVRAELQKLAAN